MKVYTLRRIFLIIFSFVGLVTGIIGKSACYAEKISVPLTVVMDDNYPPYAFRNSQGKLIGIVPDLWKLWEAYTGIEVKIIGTEWDKAIEVINSGKADVIDTIFKTPERTSIYEFSEPYAEITVSIYHIGTIGGITDLASLHGFAVAVKKGDASVKKLKEGGITNLTFYPSYESIIKKAKSGEVKIFCMDDPPAVYFLNKYGIAGKFRKAFVLYKGAFHRAVLKGNEEILGSVILGFSLIPKKAIDEVYEKWKGKPIISYGLNRYWLYLFLVLFFLICCTIAWNLSLSRMVRKKTVELRLALGETKRKEDFLKTTLYSISDAVIIVDSNIVVQRMNETAELLTGWREEKAVGKHLCEIFRVIDEQTGKELTNFFIDTPQKGRVAEKSNHVLLVSNENNNKYPITCSASPILGPSNEFWGIVLVFRDQTEERNKRKQLEFAYKQLSVALDGADLALTNIHVPTETLHTNDKFIEMVGLSKDEFDSSLNFLGKLIHSDDRDRVISNFKKHVRGEINFFEEQYRLYHKKGYYIAVHARGRVIEWDENRKPVWFSGVIMDITEWKNLTERVGLLERQLAQTAKLEALGRLAGGVAHDFNNVLQVIYAQCELALFELEPDSPVASRLQEIRGVAGRASNIVRQLLAFARKESAEPARINISAHVIQTMKVLKKFVGENIELRLDLENNLWDVFMDPAQLDQVIINLLVNSSDAIQGRGVITIKTRNEIIREKKLAYMSEEYLMPGEYVKLSIEDTGHGMDEETLERIFDPFFTTKPEGKGSGLGMSTVYGIVKQNGGYIIVESEKGKGTVVTIYFPRYVPENKPAEDDNSRSVVKNGHDKSTPRSILLVEDEVSTVSVLKEMLEQNGFMVYAFTTPVEAINWIQSGDPSKANIDLVITDVVLPQMSGVELWEKLKQFRGSMKCLFISAYPDEIIEKYGDYAGCHFLRKPFTGDRLLEKITEIFST